VEISTVGHREERQGNPFYGDNIDDGHDSRSKYSTPVTILLHMTLVAFLEDVYITVKLYNDTPDT
jgi:hypothetical protein